MALKSLREEFRNAVAGGESALRVNTDEQEDALRTVTDVCKKYGWELRVWDHTAGTVWLVGEPPEHRKKKVSVPKGTGAAMAELAGQAQASPSVLGELREFLNEPVQVEEGGGDNKPVVTVFKNFHLACDRDRGAVVSTVQHLVSDKVRDTAQFKDRKHELAQQGIEPDTDTGKFVVGFMPEEAQLPPEVRPLFKVITHELPDEEELGHILAGVVEGLDDSEPPSAEDRKRICRFAVGLTRLQAEGVFGACMVEHHKVLPDYVWREKSAVLNKEGLVELYQGREKFADVAGLDGAKEFMLKLLTPDEWDEKDPDVRAKGVLFVGPPGVGKSLIAKAAGNELGLPTLMVHPGNWMGSLVGESEAKTRKGFQILRAHAPCIAVVDEVEKVMPSSRGGDHDGGVGARMEGSFLTAMNDVQEDVFWCFTANDIQRMHEAFFRAERVDAVFYVGLPTALARAALWKLYLKKFFPSHVDGRPFPRAIDLNVDALAAEYRKAKKPDPDAWANKFAAAVMCLPPNLRDGVLGKVAKATSDEFATAVRDGLVKDDGWTPAEIRACCRLSRRLGESLVKTARRVRPVSVTAAKVVKRLEEWASEAALDAETGEVYEMSEETEELIELNAPKKAAEGGKGKIRRRVRTLGD